MKKSFKLLIVTAFIIICLFTLFGCDNTLNDAYQKAVEDGFIGTQAEWLDSLTAGKSAYEIAVENGYTGTEAEWLASLNGKDGKNGTNGNDGANGLAGVDGKDGKSPTLEEIYDAAVDAGYEGSFLDFLQNYLDLNISNNTQVATNIAVRSGISVFCKFTVPAQGGGTTESASAGSGIIYTIDKENGDAYFITNYHVVYNKNSTAANKIADTIRVYLYGLEWGPDYNSKFQEGDLDYSIPVEYIGGTMTYDIAVLKVVGNNLLKNSISEAVTVANTNHIPVGTTAIAVGNPEAVGLSATAGIISVDSELISMTAADEITPIAFRVMRIDAAVNGGNSGGGLFNSNGELIGIVNAKISSSTIENIGYAIPSNLAVNAAQNIINNCDGTLVEKIQKPILGVTVQIMSAKIEYDNNTQAAKIVEEIRVNSFKTVSDTDSNIDSLAYDSGMRVGDKLIEVRIQGNKYTIDRLFILSDLLLLCEENETIVITVERLVEDVPTLIDITIALNADCITEIP